MRNTGQSEAKGTRVDFYWANPSAQVVVGVASKIGSAFVDLAPGDVQDVLCLVAIEITFDDSLPCPLKAQAAIQVV